MTWEDLYRRLGQMTPEERRKKAWVLVEAGETAPLATVQEVDDFDIREEYPMIELGESYQVGFS